MMPYQSANCRFTHFPVDVMMIGFDIPNWNYSNDSDLSSFIMADDSIDLIKDEFNIMTERLWCQILEASPYAKIQCQVRIIKKVKRNQHLSSYRILFHYQTYLAM